MTSFAADIRPLFRDEDIDAMQSWFDLGAYDDARTHAHAIYERIRDGSMPCDTPWPPDRLQRFRDWMDEGFPA
jgi:hypothetical protein